jgi:hypothetical protein
MNQCTRSYFEGKTMKLTKWLGLFLLFCMAVMPVTAQEATQQNLVILQGVYTISDDNTIIVAEYVIDPADASLPSDLSDGDNVIITGYLLEDGVTIEAISIEIAMSDDEVINVDEPEEDENTNPGNGNGGDNGQGNGGGNSNDQGNGNRGNNGGGNGNDQGNGNRGNNGNNAAGGEERNAFCGQTERRHRAAERLAEEIGVDYTQVMASFCGGRGFGQILIAYRIAQASGQSAESIWVLRDSGQGWGQIIRDLDLNPREIMGRSPGRNNGRGNN